MIFGFEDTWPKVTAPLLLKLRLALKVDRINVCRKHYGLPLVSPNERFGIIPSTLSIFLHLGVTTFGQRHNQSKSNFQSVSFKALFYKDNFFRIGRFERSSNKINDLKKQSD